MIEDTPYKSLPSSRIWSFPVSGSLGLYPRLLGTGLLLALEVVLLSIWLDTQELQSAGGLTQIIANWGPGILRSLIAGALASAAIVYFRADRILQPISGHLKNSPLALSYL